MSIKHPNHLSAAYDTLRLYADALGEVDTVQKSVFGGVLTSQILHQCEESSRRIDDVLLRLKGIAYDLIVDQIKIEDEAYNVNVTMIIDYVQALKQVIQGYRDDAARVIQHEQARKEIVQGKSQVATTVESPYRPGDVIQSKYVDPKNFYVTNVLPNGNLEGYRLTTRGKINKRHTELTVMTPRVSEKGKHAIIRRNVPLSEIEIDTEDEVETETENETEWEDE